MADMLMPLQIQRQYASSLDADYEFATLEELKEYATTSALSYSGQVLYCKANDTLYKVNAAKTAVEAIGEGGGGGTNTYTTLAELGLTADATFQDVVDTLPEGGSALLGVKEFTNYQTIFPYEEGNDQFARVHIIKGVANGSCVYARWFRKDGVKEAIAIFNIDDNKFGGWRILKDQQIYTSLSQLGLTADATIDDVRGALQAGESCIIRTDSFADLTQFKNIQYGYLKITKTVNAMCEIWLNDVTTEGNLYYGKQKSGKFSDWISLSKHHRIVTQANAGYFKFLAPDAFLQPLNITVTDQFGGCVVITGSTSTDNYKHHRAIRLSNGNWNNEDPTNAGNNKIEGLYYYDKYYYLKVGNYTTATITGLIEPPVLVETIDAAATEIVIKSVFDVTGKAYTTLAELGLTADATVDDVYSALKDGETAILATSEFTNQLTMFPNFCTNDQYAILQVEKKNSNRAFIEWRQKEGNAYAIAGLNSNNQFTNWGNIVRFKKDGFADDSIVCIGDTASADGVIQTLTSLGFTTDVMTWDTGVYRVSHVSGLTNLPSDIVSAAPGFRLEHYDCKKWGANHNPNKSTWAIRHSVLYAESGNIYHRYTESGATAGVYAKDTGWQKIQTTGSNVTLVTNAQTLKLDITKKNSSWYGAIKLTYLFDTSLVEAEIDFRSATDTLKWAISKGQKYIKKITYTQDANNKAHYTIGIEFSGTTYGCYQAEVIGGFADINSLTEEAFTGDTTAVYGNVWGKNNGVTLVTAPEDLELTSPCTTIQLAQAMRNTFNKTITSGAIGVFNNGGSTITDAPSDYGLLHIETFGHDRIMIRYDGIGSSIYAGSWIGQIKGSNGTFSSITWAKIGTDNSVPGRYVADISGSAITIKMTRHDPVKQGIMKIQYNKWITTATYDTRTIELSINPNFPRYTGSHPDEITSVTYNWSGSTATDCSICISVSGSFNPYVIVDMDPTYATINSVTNASTALAYTANPMQASSSTSKTFSNSDVLAADTEIILQPGSGTSLSSSGYEIKNGICYFVVNIQTSSGGTYKPSTTYKVVQLPVPLRYPVAADINGRIYTEISDNKAWVEGDGILRVVMTHTAATYHNLYVSGSYPVQ